MLLAGVVIGFAAGIPFAPSFYGAAKARPAMPGTSVAYVNAFASVVILLGAPLVGLTFALPGDGRIGFAIIAAVWVLSILALPSRKLLGLDDPACVAERDHCATGLTAKWPSRPYEHAAERGKRFLPREARSDSF